MRINVRKSGVWDEAKHPRGPAGKWVNAIRGLDVGSTGSLNGGYVKRTGTSRFTTHRQGHSMGNLSAAEAAHTLTGHPESGLQTPPNRKGDQSLSRARVLPLAERVRAHPLWDQAKAIAGSVFHTDAELDAQNAKVREERIAGLQQKYGSLSDDQLRRKAKKGESYSVHRVAAQRELDRRSKSKATPTGDPLVEHYARRYKDPGFTDEQLGSVASGGGKAHHRKAARHELTRREVARKHGINPFDQHGHEHPNAGVGAHQAENLPKDPAALKAHLASMSVDQLQALQSRLDSMATPDPLLLSAVNVAIEEKFGEGAAPR